MFDPGGLTGGVERTAGSCDAERVVDASVRGGVPGGGQAVDAD